MKKTKKLIIGVVLILFVIGIAISAVLYLSSGEITWGYIKTQFVSGTPDWKTYNCPDGSFSLESPFPINWTTKNHITNGKGFLQTFGISQLNRSGFVLSVFYKRYTDPSLSLNEKENFWKQEAFEKEPTSTWNKQVVTCSGMPASIVNYTRELDGGCTTHFTNLFIAKKNQTWLINATSFQNKSDTSFNEWTKRIIDSIKIAPQNQ